MAIAIEAASTKSTNITTKVMKAIVVPMFR